MADLGICPSGCPEDPTLYEKAIFGIVGGTPEQPTVNYLPEPVPFTTEQAEGWLADSPIAPDEIFRAAGRCKGAICRQWDENRERCTLVDRWLTALEPVTDELPRCALRAAGCRAWQQNGPEACRRCPGFATKTITGLDGDPLQRASLEKVYL